MNETPKNFSNDWLDPFNGKKNGGVREKIYMLKNMKSAKKSTRCNLS